MKSLLYIIAILFVIAWAIGYLVYNAAPLIHILLVFAISTTLLRIIGAQKPVG